MGKYTCEKCGKDFTQKSHYTTHLNKKNPCIVESKLHEIANNAVNEKLIEINVTSPTGLVAIQNLYNSDVGKIIVDKIETKLKSCYNS